MDQPLALYRRYRPDTFAEVIGQDHVTGPLRQALAANRVHHAYLFSGPRGCGKTTSARILARALNCAQAPVADPCGECQSCRDLARGGPGSVDVIEIDAASHGGVDDARELREKAFFSPMSSRFKVYIVDEAHMVSPQGFNALLKLVEEPPAHLKFIFATTEPDKVIGTIRSRTHHYPFRLMPPRVLGDYLADLCEREGVKIEPSALPLVVRAGAGSARDSLSVLDQLIGGAGSEGVTYDLASALLGYTPETLLDEVVDAFAAADGASVFAAVDKVVETGQDPRRFAEDLLQRFRDLIIVAAVPDALAKGLLDVSQDMAERLTQQATKFGPADLTRSADVVIRGLDEIKGATAPRLLLELICARVLLPGADHDAEGVYARLDRMERRMSIPAAVAPAQAQPPSSPPTHQPAGADVAPRTADQEATWPVARTLGGSATGSSAVAPPGPAPTPADQVEDRSASASVQRQGAPRPAGASAAGGSEAGGSAAGSGSPATPSAAGMGLVDVRRLWTDVLEDIKGRRRLAWSILSHNAQVQSVEGGTLTLAVSQRGARDSFVTNGCDEILRQSLIDVLGVDWRVEVVVDPSADSDAGGPSGGDGGHASQPPSTAPQAPARAAVRAPANPESVAAARGAISPTRANGSTGHETPPPESDEAVDRDDPVVDDASEDHDQLLARELGAHVIEEIPHDS